MKERRGRKRRKMGREERRDMMKNSAKNGIKSKKMKTKEKESWE